MKKEKRFSRSIALLVAILLTVTSAFSNYSFVNAAEDDGATETQDSEKELVQCSDDWVIFKYKDENGKPQFDITYQGKTIDELETEGYTMQYQVFLKGKNYESYESIWHPSYSGSISSTDFPGKTSDLFVQFILYSYTNMIKSEILPLYSNNNSSPYILSANYGYLSIYDLTKNKPNSFKVELKISEHLKQTGNLSILKKSTNSAIDTETINVSNLTFENISENYTIENKSYKMDYSIVTFDLEVPSKYFYSNTSEEISKALIIYIFSFNGIVGLNSNNEIENLQFNVRTPAFPSEDILVQSITINSSSSTITAGNSINLSASILPTNATNKKLNWSSSNSEYATVDKNGVVTTKPAGAGKTVTITAKATDGSNVSATFKLKINKVLVNKIKLKAKKSVKAGKKLKITFTVNSDATNKSLKWSVSNKKYATINSKGVLTAKKAGKGKTVKVTAKAKDGSGKKATIKIKIKK